MSVVIIFFFYRMKTLNLLIGIILLLVVIIFMLWTPQSPVLVNATPGYADINVQGVQGWNPVAHPYTRMVAPGHLGVYGGNVAHVGGFGRHVGGFGRHGRR
jgi:hypothetical protein